MKASDQAYFSWKRYGLAFVCWVFARFPFMGEILNAGSRCVGLLQAWYLVSRTGIAGDYIEFGVFQGDLFKLSLHYARRCFKSTPAKLYAGKFIACDSFQGLPETPSMNDADNIFAAGQYSSSRKGFEKNIRCARGSANVVILEGWFDKTLTPDAADKHDIKEIAIAVIDCDLVESTRSCLDFLTPLVRTGTMLILDDFYSMRGSMKAGEALALEEWCWKNPSIRLVPYLNYGVTGMIFIVNRAETDSLFYLK